MLGKIGILASALAAGGASNGCSSSGTGGPTGGGGSAGTDGSVQGSGGSAGSGGTAASGGIPGSGGIGSGGIASGGAGAGGIAAGGAGGKATGGSGAGGMGSGGISSLDAGICIGAACASDAGARDATPGDVPAATCSQITTQAACDVRGNCHSVYVDPGTCGCSGAGCCAHFDHCADGGQANCAGPALCKAATPFCEAPFVVSYSGSCYEGCVRQNECPPPTCPQTPPTNAATCGPVDFSCFYEDCAGAGRAQAVCSAGTWQVQTGACSTVPCMGGGITAGTLTCTAGQVCVRTTSGGGAYIIQPSCVTNTCGKGPISPQCIQGLPSSCFGSYSLSGVQINCSLPSSCGQGQGGCA